MGILYPIYNCLRIIASCSHIIEFILIKLTIKTWLTFIVDMAFSSHTDGGKLKYTTSSLMDVLGVTYEDLEELEYITFSLSLLDYDPMT